MFTFTCDYLEKIMNQQDTYNILENMKSHLRELKIQLSDYFLNDYDFSKRWVLNMFYETVAAAKLSVEIHNQFIELSADKILQLQI